MKLNIDIDLDKLRKNCDTLHGQDKFVDVRTANPGLCKINLFKVIIDIFN